MWLRGFNVAEKIQREDSTCLRGFNVAERIERG